LYIRQAIIASRRTGGRAVPVPGKWFGPISPNAQIATFVGGVQ
jgi:hypothetical protein